MKKTLPFFIIAILIGFIFILKTSEEPIIEISLGAGTEDVMPNATVSETGGSCDTSNAHTQMDNDPDSGVDGNECLADSDIVNHDIHFNFGTPTDGDDVDAGTDAQVFAILIKHSKATGNGNPTVALDLYCNGTLRDAGADQTFTDDYTVISESFTFDAGNCAVDGSDVEVFIDCTAADGGGTNNDASCSYEAIEWEATTAAEAAADTKFDNEHWFN